MPRYGQTPTGLVEDAMVVTAIILRSLGKSAAT